jgi:hypothetical protein
MYRTLRAAHFWQQKLRVIKLITCSDVLPLEGRYEINSDILKTFQHFLSDLCVVAID